MYLVYKRDSLKAALTAEEYAALVKISQKIMVFEGTRYYSVTEVEAAPVQIKKKKANKNRLQRLTNIHRIHHIYWSYGWTFYGIGWGYFKAHGFKRIRRADYHDCTASKVY